MSAAKRLGAAFKDAPILLLAQSSRYVIISDCHRGTGKAGDNFLKNEYLYLAALDFYFRKGFTYLELGDGDELWENRSIARIRELHSASFEMMNRFFLEGRLYELYGNHDMVKKKPSFSERRIYSGMILKDCEQKRDIYLTHGHQADFLNSSLWRFSRFLVRYVWRPLEALGIPDPTSASKNNTRKEKSERTLTRWAAENNCVLITGHTHRPMIGTKDAPYCNSGSCVHPGDITCIEIENRCLTLVKWSVKARHDFTLYTAREILGKTVCLDEM
ncbi:MAG: metallophosphoesterase family protein [Eubacteriales bacterium]|nr:metallophosphoesterase family protein [Eubacteriales bacterium]